MKRSSALSLIVAVCFGAASCDDSSSGEATDTTEETDTEGEGDDTESADSDSGESGTDTDESDTEAAETDEAETDSGEGNGGESSMSEPEMAETEGGEELFAVSFTDEGEQCGDELCNDLLLEDLSLTVKGCCSEDPENVCGLDMRTIGILLQLTAPGCEPLNLPGAPSPECEMSGTKEVSLGGEKLEYEMEGCCQPSGKCGYVASFGDLGFGCVDKSRFVGESEGNDCEYVVE